MNKDYLNRSLLKIAETLDIPDSYFESAERRYKAIGKWLDRDTSGIKQSTPEIFTQGSIRLGTIIKPLSNKDEYDIDLVCKLMLSKSTLSQESLKKIVGKEINEYTKANSIKTPNEEHRRCWRINYAESTGALFHMDILPALPDNIFNTNDKRIAITDNKHFSYHSINPDWPKSNPDGYATWFYNRMNQQLYQQRVEKAKSLNKSVDDVPEYTVRTTLQRAIQILKRHRDIMFEKDRESQPISMVITTLAAQAYNNEEGILDALISIIKNMPNYITVKNGIIWVTNPANPFENFADKWKENQKLKESFYAWVNQLKLDFIDIDTENQNTIEKMLKERLGDNIGLRGIRKLEVINHSVVVKNTNNFLSKFNVQHKQSPKWPLDLFIKVKIKATASKNGWRAEELKSDSSLLGKHFSLRFEAQLSCDISGCKFYWQVVNTGTEAAEANAYRGGFYDSTIAKGTRVREESTLYKGMHWIECFVLKDGTCIARSGEFVVNIE